MAGPGSIGTRNGMGTAALVMGILQFFCLGIVGSILAIIFGRIGMTRAMLGQASNGGTAKAGFWLGIVGLILNILVLLLLIITGTLASIFGTN